LAALLLSQRALRLSSFVAPCHQLKQAINRPMHLRVCVHINALLGSNGFHCSNLSANEDDGLTRIIVRLNALSSIGESEICRISEFEWQRKDQAAFSATCRDVGLVATSRKHWATIIQKCQGALLRHSSVLTEIPHSRAAISRLPNFLSAQTANF
jgi:hypothetical protein